MAGQTPASPKSYTCELQVRWGDSDRLGHVNNVKYQEYAQEARLRFIRDVLGMESLAGPVVARRTVIDFERALVDDSDPLTVEVYVTHIGTSSYTLRHVIHDRDGTRCSTVDVVLVAVKMSGPGVPEGSRPIEPELRTLLAEYLHEPDSLEPARA